MMNPVQTKDDMASKLQGLAHLFDSAEATTRVVIEMPAKDAAGLPDALRAAANMLRADEERLGS